jgi:pimeloyl-ACP methyl ester carboxylesterase
MKGQTRWPLKSLNFSQILTTTKLQEPVVMPYLKKDNLSLHYTDHGEGEAIITLHGLSESGLYWTLPGITDQLVAAGYRVINVDMRAHGRTSVSGQDKGYDVDTMARDIDRLADSLDLERFHLLTHATGGMVGFRYAMKNSDRLLSVMATNTGSSTLPSDEAAALTDPSVELPKVDISKTELGQNLIAGFRGLDWETIMAGARETAREHIFLNSMHKAVSPESAFAMFEACAANANPNELADFVGSFYNDPDPKISGLRAISCPCFMLEGEHDVQFIKPAELVAREVPNCTHKVLEGMGHMLAFEDPQQLADEILGFLCCLR